MPRIRTIKPEFWEDEAVGTLSVPARLMFIATWNLADDEGLLRWSAAYLKASVFMYDDDVEVDHVQAWMEEIEAEGLVHPYKGGKTQQRLGWIVNFRKHQKINRPQPGRLPPPSLQNRDVKSRYAERDGHVCGICNEPITERFGEEGPSVDHITPRSSGGTDHPSNIQVSHLRCNKGKGDKDLNRSVNDSVNDARDPITGSLNDSPPEVEGNREEERREEREAVGASPSNEGSEAPGASDTNSDVMTADELVAKWLDTLAERPPSKEVGKQGEAARRICVEASRHQIELAFRGMGKVFPFSQGEPWDLMTLEKWFSRALQAGSGGGDAPNLGGGQRDEPNFLARDEDFLPGGLYGPPLEEPADA